MSYRTRERSDEEQQALADEAMRLAVRTMQEHWRALEAFAAELLATESLERADIDRLMAKAGGGGRPAGAHPGLRVVAASGDAS